MSSYYLIGAVRLGTTIYRPGRLVSDTDPLYAELVSAGAALVISTNATVAAGAAKAAKAAANGADDQVLESIMRDAVASADEEGLFQHKYTGDQDIASAVTTTTNETTGVVLSANPVRGVVLAFLDGAKMVVGDGVKTKDVYFSRDAGVTALATADVIAGDTLFWTKARESYDLDITNFWSLDYDVLG